MSVVEQEVQEGEGETWQEREVVPSRILQGKKALVTGGSRGIGKATVLALAQAGADVAINYHHCAEAAEAVCRDAREFDVRAHTYQADIAREDETKRMTDALLDDFGVVDILINNAGITHDKTFLKMSR
jgi:3-oxoacyl-[acyl-carrier protein] reductase